MPSPNSAAVLQTREYVEAIDGADGGILRAKTNMSENGVSDGSQLHPPLSVDIGPGKLIRWAYQPTGGTEWEDFLP